MNFTCVLFLMKRLKMVKIKTVPIKKMWGLGTPEDLRYFLKYYKG